MSKAALVSGCAGFIGSNMVDLLLSKGYKVIGLDNLSTGSKNNISHLKENKKFIFKKIDILRLKKNEKLFKNIDYVFHFAGLADLVPSIENPIKYIETNFLGTLKMLECSKNFKVKKFIYAASASCYGKTEKIVKESNPINTEHPYAFSKYLGELATVHWNKVYKLEVKALRIFNAYGPRSRTSGAYGAVMGVFFKQKLSKKPFTVVGSGNQSRDFVHVKDITNAFLLSATNKTKEKIFNVGTSKPQKINKLVKIIGGNKIFIPNRPGEAFKSQANINKIKKKLGWYPKINFERGMKDLLKSINDWKNAPLWDKKKIKKATKNWFKHLS